MVLGKNIDTIIFDLDGTLLDLNIDWSAVKAAIGLRQDESLQVFMEKVDATERARVYSVLDKAEHDGFGEGFNDETTKQLEQLIPDYKLIIFSRNSEDIITTFLTKASKLLAEQTLVVGRKVGSPVKPDVTDLIKRHKVRSNSVLVGDTSHDVDVAGTLGIPCIIIHNQKNNYTPPGASIYVDSLLEAIHKIAGSKQ